MHAARPSLLELKGERISLAGGGERRLSSALAKALHTLLPKQTETVDETQA